MSFLNPIAGGHQNIGNPQNVGQSPVDILRNLINQGISDSEAIMAAMGVTRQKLVNLQDKLVREDRQYYHIDYPESLREVKVGREGGISISPRRVDALGLQAVFAPESVLDIVRNGNSLVINVQQPVSAPIATPVAPPVAAPVVPAATGGTQ